MVRKKGEDRKKSRKYKVGRVPAIQAPNFIMNPAELYQYLPKDKRFIIKRAYWITTPINEKKSGQHAHLKEEELFIVIQGKTFVILDDDGKGRKKIKLTKNNSLWVPRMVWHGFENLSSDCILLALSSTNYNPNRSDYIENYEKFVKSVKK